ncbi:MAG: hybrid sensor histidine kinase/response regulator [Candidatus Delongbacteria bacterium]|nr:hybrid sensor histidine kinase/response regulator [Candidatus Delongbacteria bacterium]MBN2834308.1 hybrid sensor histidine kinase/response regulator [Candidatus Delongbacteria bacterium]
MNNEYVAKILTIDDERINNKIISSYLNSFNFESIELTEPELINEYIDKFSPDLILLDLIMPSMSGQDVLTILKATNRYKHIPVIIVSGDKSDETLNKCLDIGAVDYLSKPVRKLELKARVVSALKIAALTRDLNIKNKKLYIANKSIEQKSIALETLNRELVKYSENLSELVDKKTDENLRLQKNAIIGDMISGLVHNLRSPLSVIKMQGELLSRKLSSLISEEDKKEDVLHRMSSIGNALDKVDKMLNALMSKKRKDGSNNLNKVNLNTFLKNEIEFLSGNNDFKNKVNKIQHLDDNISLCIFNESDVSQVLYNLINNSMDAMYEQINKQITFRTYENNEGVYLEIEDNGPGIKEEHMAKLFDPFFTTKPPVEDAKDGKPTGTGLGLHSVNQLLDVNNAFIHFESEVGSYAKAIIVFKKAGE